MKPCFCGSDKIYKDCCGVFISGQQHAPTPETLMRSRYTAYVRGNINYIAETMKGPATVGFDIERAKRRANVTKWLGLKIINAPQVAQDSKVGYVEFEAYFQGQGRKQHQHEMSEFHLIDGRWYYVDGQTMGCCGHDHHSHGEHSH